MVITCVNNYINIFCSYREGKLPYSKDKLSELPSSTKNLTKKQKEKFVEVFNALEDQGMEESAAIGIATKEAKRVKIKKATSSQVKKLDNGNIEYLGEQFPGFNKPIKGSGNKQGKVLAKKGDEIKIVSFGDPNLEDNYSTEANDAFYARFGNQEGMSDVFSPLYWSAKWLWPKGSMKGKGPKDFYKINKSSKLLKSIDNDLMQTIDVVYEPNKLDIHGQWMSKKTIENACDNFNKNLKTGSVKTNLYHIAPTDKFEIVKSWINEFDCQVGDQFVPEGTWLVKIQYKDALLWKMRKAGDICGVSIGAMGRIHEEEVNDGSQSK